MSAGLERRIAEIEAENAELKGKLEAQAKIAARALASYQQRALHMEIIRQQNEDLDRLAADLAEAKHQVEQRAKEIEQAARLKSEFLANFSHEIRTPLNGIIGYCDLLSREEGSRLTAHGRRDLGTIRSNAKTLLALINDILDLSKIESGHIEVVKETVDVGALYDECAATVRDLLKGKDVVVSARIEENARYLYTDQLKLRQILLNLLSNAAKFTEIGEIVVDVRSDGDGWRIAVEDTGSGIPAEHLPHVFEKFRQVDGSRTRRQGGTGLGLAIVKEITRILGGEVTVSSVLGRGTSFTVTFRGIVEPIAVAPVRQSEPSPGRRSGGAQVLLIDDDPMIQQLLRGELEPEGFEVVSALDGVEGLQLARRRRPNIVVLDIHLPRLDGWSVLSMLKADRSLSDVPVVIISVEEQRARGFSLGAFDYLVKPIEPDTLLSVVARAARPDAGEVLVVDDDSDTRALVARRLRAEDFAVIEVSSGEEALSRVERSNISLMVLDLIMPGMDGFEVLRRVREAKHNFPIVVLTGKSLTEDELETLHDGLARVIKKGGTGVDQLVQQVKVLIVHQRNLQTAKLPRVLYVEDIPQNRDIVRRYLRGVYQVIEAEDGESGIRRAEQERPDLILMDLSLPRIDGWEVTRRLKANPDLAGIPVVALTAHANREDMDRAVSAGCSAYLTKPVDCDQLINAIQHHLRPEGT